MPGDAAALEVGRSGDHIKLARNSELIEIDIAICERGQRRSESRLRWPDRAARPAESRVTPGP
jgi:hypothetical protein